MARNDKARKIGSYIFAVAAILGGILVIFLSTERRQMESALDKRGVHVTGIVDHGWVGKQDRTGRRRDYGPPPHYLAVRYPVGNTSEYVSFNISSGDYRRYAQPGSQVPVVYDPQNPESARLEGGLDTNQSSLEMLLGGAGCIILGVGLLLYLVAYYKRKALEESYPDVNHLDLIGRGRGP